MRQDQYLKLQQLEEKLLDVFLAEADPEHWPGRGLKIGDMDAKTRGDLYWVRKTAASAGMLFSRVEAMVGKVQGIGTTLTPEDAPETGEQQLDADIAAAEREAAKLMAELQTGGKSKKAFDRKVHGRP